MAGTNNPDGFDKLLNVILPKKSREAENWAMEEKEKNPRFNIDNPRYNQSNFFGRYKHFAEILHPKNLFKTDAELYRAKDLVNKFRKGDDLLGMTDDDIWEQKATIDSAFNPLTGDKEIISGRIGALLPINMAIIGGMKICQKNAHETFLRSSTPYQIFLQWVLQTCNAVFNMSSTKGGSLSQVGTAYVCSTAAGVGSVLGLRHVFRNTQSFHFKFTPLWAATVANSMCITVMRFGELSNGSPIFTSDNKEIGQSKIAARQGVSQVITSRFAMTCPNSVLLPIAMEFLRSKGAFKNHPKVAASLHLCLFGVIFLYAIPLGCCLYPQIHPISSTDLEPELQEKIQKLPGPPTKVFYNKGL
ncbi:unnamed protein product [Allacma fusca]|uniref:Sidoreflexin n=1 Tax=Allacma fusca TaxID=39272 RepID=A0A8J2L7G4_9HEXA|nr:unnamed protein product [Allacma fusca]